VQNYAAEIEIYELKTFGQSAGHGASDGFGGWDCVQFILGETTDGDWVGIAPKLKDTSGWAKAVCVQQGEYQLSNVASQFINHMATVSESLNRKFIQPLFSASNVDDSIYQFAEIEGITYQTAGSREALLEVLLGAGNLLGAYPFEGFTVSEDIEYGLVALEGKLNSTGLSQDDQQLLLKYRQSKTLKDFLALEMKGTQLYQLGYGVCIRHYVFGQLENCDWAGVVSFSVYS
jgi:hypothetical protein